MKTHEKPHGELEFVPLGKLTIYPITEHELNALKNGSPESIYLTFGIACLTTALTAFLSVITLSTNNPSVINIYWIIIIIGFLAGCVLMALWHHYKGQNLAILENVRNRKSPEGTQIGPPDLPPIQNQTQDALLILLQGIWLWQGCHTVTISETGDLKSTSGESASYIMINPPTREFSLKWSSGWIDKLHLSADGNIISGTNNVGNTVSAERKQL